MQNLHSKDRQNQRIRGTKEEERPVSRKYPGQGWIAPDRAERGANRCQERSPSIATLRLLGYAHQVEYHQHAKETDRIEEEVRRIGKQAVFRKAKLSFNVPEYLDQYACQRWTNKGRTVEDRRLQRDGVHQVLARDQRGHERRAGRLVKAQYRAGAEGQQHDHPDLNDSCNSQYTQDKGQEQRQALRQ